MITFIASNEIVFDVHDKNAPIEAYKPFALEGVLGGAGWFNALALAECLRGVPDTQAIMLGAISEDRFGNAVRTIGAELGINTSFAKATAVDTLMALVKKGEHNNTFDFPNLSYNAMRETKLADLTAPQIEGHKIALIQGLCANINPVWMEYAQASPETMIVYDANIRMPAIPNIADHQKHLADWASQAAVMKVSDADIQLIYGDYADFDRVVNTYLHAGAAMVCVTQGSKDTLVYTHKGKTNVPVEAGSYQKTVGAGDNFLGGMAAALALKGMFSRAIINAAPMNDISFVVQSGVGRAAQHLRLINA